MELVLETAGEIGKLPNSLNKKRSGTICSISVVVLHVGRYKNVYHNNIN